MEYRKLEFKDKNGKVLKVNDEVMIFIESFNEEFRGKILHPERDGVYIVAYCYGNEIINAGSSSRIRRVKNAKVKSRNYVSSRK